MSHVIINRAWATRTDNASDKLVLVRLADQSNDEGICWPSMRSIAETCNIGRRTVINVLNRLEQAGYVRTLRRERSNGSHSSNAYIVCCGMERAELERITAKVELEFQAQYRPVGSESNSLGGGESDSLPSESNSLGGGESDSLPSESNSLLESSLNHQSFESLSESKRAPQPPNQLNTQLAKLVRQMGIAFPKTETERSIVEQGVTWDWLKATGFWPGYKVAAEIGRRLGPNPSVALLERACTLWLTAGYKIRKVDGVLDWYDKLTADPTWTPSRRFQAPQHGPNRPTLADMAANPHQKVKGSDLLAALQTSESFNSHPALPTGAA